MLTVPCRVYSNSCCSIEPGIGPPDRVPLQDLEVGLLIDADHPIALAGQPLGVGVAPEDLLGPLLELVVQPGRPPVPGAVRLEVHLVEDRADRPVADGRDDAVGDRLAGQVLAGPVGDVQALGDRLQAGQLDDLGPLEGGKSGRAARSVAAVPGGRAGPSARSGGRPSRSSSGRTGSARPAAGSVPRRRRPGRSGPAGPDTRGRTGSGRSPARSGHRRGRSSRERGFRPRMGRLR